ncbi:hypothetical protein WR25_26609 [Diploscapter pachys]|uniref:Uncharacterized protein n=1 Tax=Diploscapter pachys TaxID=2018661 RepID=A0A2A2KNK0_9BILA|nr:hypothetical protein WR25_26609 [Diploscapter pachys]
MQALRQDLQAARDTFRVRIRNELAAFDPQTLRAQLQFLMAKRQEGKQLEEKKLQLQEENEQIRAELETVRQELDEAFAARKKEEICVEELNGKLCEIKSILKKNVIELDEVKKKNARLREENEKKIKAKKEAEHKQVKASKEPTPRRVSFEEEEDTEVMVPIEQNNDHSPSSAASDALPSHPTPHRSSTSKNRSQLELDMLVDLMGADDSMIDSRTDEDEFNFTVSFIPEPVKHNNDKDENKGSKDSSQGKEKKKVPAIRRRDSSSRPRNQITPDYNAFRAGANPLFTSTPHRSRVSNFFELQH